MRLRFRSTPALVGALVLSAALSVPARGQSAQEAEDPGAGAWLIGGSVGLPTASLEPEFVLMTFGLHFLRLSDNGPFGFETSVGTMPAAFFGGSLPLGVRAGFNVPIRPSPKHLLIPVAGVSLLTSFSGHELIAVPGLHVGGTVARIGGLRAGVTTHWLEGASSPIWLIELGFLGPPL